MEHKTLILTKRNVFADTFWFFWFLFMPMWPTLCFTKNSNVLMIVPTLNCSHCILCWMTCAARNQLVFLFMPGSCYFERCELEKQVDVRKRLTWNNRCNFRLIQECWTELRKRWQIFNSNLISVVCILILVILWFLIVIRIRFSVQIMFCPVNNKQ